MDILTLETSKGNSVDGHTYTRDIKGKVWMDIHTLDTSKGYSVDGHSYTRDIKGI